MIKFFLGITMLIPATAFASKQCAEVHLFTLERLRDPELTLAEFREFGPSPELGNVIRRPPPVRPETLPDPILISEHQHVLHPSGRIRLLELVGDRSSHHKRINYTNSLVRQLNEQFPEIQFQSGDALLGLQITGDRARTLSRFANSVVNRLTMDFIGVQILTVKYVDYSSPYFRARDNRGGSDRVVIVIKNNAEDYRGLGDPLTGKTAIANWIGEQLNSRLGELLNEGTFLFYENGPQFQAAYRAMASNYKSRRTLSEAEFARRFATIYLKFANNLDGLDLLHMRPSFWDARPKPDAFAIDTFEAVFQKKADSFVQDFTVNALKLRERLAADLHRMPSGSGRASKLASDIVEHASRADLGRIDPAFSGRTTQTELGLDFHTSREYWERPLADLRMLGNQHVNSAVNKLKRHGITEMVELKNMDAGKLVEQTSMEIHELLSLAREMVQHGIFLSYPNSIIKRMAPEDWTQLRQPPREFDWSPTELIYFPRQRSE